MFPIVLSGEFAALLTALLWSFTAVFFELASKRIGSLMLNLLRLIVALVLFTFLRLITHQEWWPSSFGFNSTLFLFLSGLVGFVFGDLFLFKAFMTIGARISMVVYSLVPPLTAFLGWILFGENMTLQDMCGLILTVTGVCIVVFSRQNTGSSENGASRPLLGVFYALAGTLGQSVGLILSRIGAPESDAFGATHLRVAAGVVGFFLIILARGALPRLVQAVQNTGAMALLSAGAFLGPFLGVSLGLYAMQHTFAGIATSLMAITPILMLVPARFIFKEKIRPIELPGTLLAFGGVILLVL